MVLFIEFKKSGQDVSVNHSDPILLLWVLLRQNKCPSCQRFLSVIRLCHQGLENPVASPSMHIFSDVMKTILRFSFILVGSVFISWLNVGCTTDKNETSPQSTCRIQQYVSVSKSKFSDQTNRINYSYDSQDKLTKTVSTMEKRPVNGATGGQTGTTTVTYTYDINGYLTASASQELYVTVSTPTNTIREQITTTKSYSYTNGRLSGYETNRIGAYGITTKVTGSLAYNPSGDLVSKTETSTSTVHDPAIAKEIPGSSAATVRIWTYQTNQLVDYVEKFGNTERRPFTIENGLITKMVFPGTNELVVTAAFDNQKRLTKREEYIDGQLSRYDVQTWTDARPSSASLPGFSGFPAVAQLLESTQTGVSSSYKSFYRNTVSKTMEPYEERVSTVQTNAQGYVTNVVTTSKHPNPAAADQDFTITETYTYSGCE